MDFFQLCRFFSQNISCAKGLLSGQPLKDIELKK